MITNHFKPLSLTTDFRIMLGLVLGKFACHVPSRIHFSLYQPLVVTPLTCGPVRGLSPKLAITGLSFFWTLPNEADLMCTLREAEKLPLWHVSRPREGQYLTPSQGKLWINEAPVHDEPPEITADWGGTDVSITPQIMANALEFWREHASKIDI